jgi:hypothetical protein
MDKLIDNRYLLYKQLCTYEYVLVRLFLAIVVCFVQQDSLNFFLYTQHYFAYPLRYISFISPSLFSYPPPPL